MSRATSAPASVGGSDRRTSIRGQLRPGVRVVSTIDQPYSDCAQSHIRAATPSGAAKYAGPDGAAQESNLPSRGLHDRTGFEGSVLAVSAFGFVLVQAVGSLRSA